MPVKTSKNSASTDRAHAQNFRQYELSARVFVDAVRNLGALPILVTQAHLLRNGLKPKDAKTVKYRYFPYSQERVILNFEKIADILKLVAREKGAELIDASTHVQNPGFFSDGIHFFENGSINMARFMKKEIERVIHGDVAKLRKRSFGG